MRRFAMAFVAALIPLASACAAPDFRIVPRFRTGEVREYRLVSDARTSISAAGFSSDDQTRLEAATRIDVEQATAAGATLILTISPRRLTRNGSAADVPPEQRIRLEVGSDGEVARVATVEGAELDAAGLEDLVPLIGPPLPPGRVHLADRWTRAARTAEGLTGGLQRARFAALRVVDGYDCAILALSTERPVSSRRTLGGQALTLEGVEFAAGEIGFAFREGFPVTVKSNAEARLAVTSQEAPGGAVVIKTVTTLTLVRRVTR